MKYLVLFIFIQFSYLFASGTIKIIDDNTSVHCIFSANRFGLFAGAKGKIFFINRNKLLEIKLETKAMVTALEEQNSYLLVGTELGEVFRIHVLDFKVEKLYALHSPILCMKSLDNNILIGTFGAGLFYNAKEIKTKMGHAPNIIFDLELWNQNMYLATEKGLYQYNFQNGNFRSLNFNFPDNVITCLTSIENELWLGSQLGYIYLWKNNTTSTIIKNTEIDIQNEITNIKIQKNNILVCSKKGVFTIDKNTGKNKQYLIQKKIWDIVISENELWFVGEGLTGKLQEPIFETLSCCKNAQRFYGYKNDRYILEKSKLFKLDAKDEKIFIHAFQDEISGIIQNNAGIWLGTINKGIFYKPNQGQHFLPIKLSNSLASSVVVAMGGNETQIWTSTLDGLWLAEAKNDYTFKKFPYPPNKIIYSYGLEIGPNNQLITCADNGQLSFYSNNLTFLYSKKISNKTIYKSLHDSNNRMWIHSSADAIIVLNENKKINLSTSNGLLSNDFKDIVVINDSIMALISNTGVSFVHTKYFWIDNFKFPNTLKNTSINTCQFYKDKLYIPSDSGILKMNINTHTLFALPQIMLASIKVNNKETNRKKTFSHNENNFQFRIRTITNQQREIYVRYRLLGLNANWQSTSDPVLHYSRLAHGTYKLQIQVSYDNYFSHCAYDELTFTIKKVFWQQTWFILFLLLTLTSIAIYWQRNRENRITKMAKLESDKFKAEYLHLRNQVNPHFLFNNFNTLIALIHENPNTAIDYTHHLSSFYRNVLQDENHLIPLALELQHLKDYFYLQKIRMDNAIHLEIDSSLNKIENIKIPSLTFQLLCENAIKHNIATATKPLYIRLNIEDNYLIFSNNIQQKLNPTKGLSLGLENIKKRYKLFCATEILIEKIDTNFTVKLPLISL